MMTFDVYSSGNDSLANGPPVDVGDHWLDDALRAVPLPDGFVARMITLAESAADFTDDRDHFSPFAPARDLSSPLFPGGNSPRGTRPR